MIFKVPNEKEPDFNIRFFQLIADNVETLGMENSRWPDSIVFTGTLGKVLYDIVIDMEWDFAKFNPKHIPATVNKIIISYSKPFPQVEEKGNVINDSIANREIEGFPDSNTLKAISTQISSGGGFKIERMIRPELKIKLER
jgi:hypothetical protein